MSSKAGLELLHRAIEKRMKPKQSAREILPGTSLMRIRCMVFSNKSNGDDLHTSFTHVSERQAPSIESIQTGFLPQRSATRPHGMARRRPKKIVSPAAFSPNEWNLIQLLPGNCSIVACQPATKATSRMTGPILHFSSSRSGTEELLLWWR